MNQLLKAGIAGMIIKELPNTIKTAEKLDTQVNNLQKSIWRNYQLDKKNEQLANLFREFRAVASKWREFYIRLIREDHVVLPSADQSTLLTFREKFDNLNKKLSNIIGSDTGIVMPEIEPKKDPWEFNPKVKLDLGPGAWAVLGIIGLGLVVAIIK